jgi:hypothetical protein
MSKDKYANLANYKEENSTKKRRPMRASLASLIKEFGISNGSFKIYVRDGKPSERVEIQKQLRQEIN